MQDTARDLRLKSNPGDAASKLSACVDLRSTCPADGGVTGCFRTIAPNPECVGARPTTATDAGAVLPTRVGTTSGRAPAGVVVLPGDDLGCLSCAFNRSKCASSSPGCFTAAPYDAGVTDTCLAYRTCLRGCEQTLGTDARKYVACANAQCKESEFPHGKASFDVYRACMFANCSDCLNPQP